MSAELLSDVGDAKGAATQDRAQSGLASLIIGAVLLLKSSIALVFNTLLWRSGPGGLPIVPALIGAVLGLLIVLSLAVFGIALGLRGLAREHPGLPSSPLASAGVATGAAATMLWLIVGIDLLSILSSFTR
jgi:hypothetical protein